MPYIKQIDVVDAVPHKILVSDWHAELEADLNWNRDGIARAGGAQIYNSNTGSESPCAFTSPKKRWTFDIEVHDLGPQFDGKTAELFMYDEDTLATRYTEKTVSLAGSLDANVSGTTAVFRMRPPWTLPMGLFGKYKFRARIVGQKEFTEYMHINLEAYYLSTPSLPKFFQDGIPLLFLRMFVLPQRETEDEQSIEKWIASVTEICFGSRKPFDGRPSDTKDHWLIYNSTGGGHPSFASTWGGQGLNLNAWLDAYRNWKQHGVYTRVNCYDQAAVTEVALCLGIAHEQIHWEYNQVYGFIDTELVGWGQVNNPYFDEVETHAFYKDEKDQNREPFNNHAYLSWSKEPVTLEFYDFYNNKMKLSKDHADYAKRAKEFEKSHNRTLYMIDSCGGPHVGTETREEYEATIDEIITDFKDCHSADVRTSFKNNPGRWKESHHLGAGVTDSYDLLPKSALALKSKTVKDISDLIMLANPGSWDVKLKLETVLDTFRTHMMKEMRPRWSNCKEYPIRPFTRNGVSVHELKFNFSNSPEKRMDRCASMRVAVSSTPDGARKALAEHLAFKTLSVDLDTSVISKGHVYDVKTHKRAVAVVGTFYIRAFVWYNVAIEITVEDKREWQERDNYLLNVILDELVGMTVAV